MFFRKKAHAVPLFLFSQKKGIKQMKKKTSLWSGVSVLLVAVLAVKAFIRGNVQIWLLAGVFAVWTAWASVRFIIPYLKLQKCRYECRKVQKKYGEKKQSHFEMPDVSDPVDLVLLRHVNFRISAYLQSAYPDATWEWREEFPEKIAAKGGTGRIQLYGVQDFNFADVSFNQNADINCELLKIVPMAELNKPSGETETIPQKRNPVDPQVWYEKQGRTVLESMIADLESRGHHSLTILENGEIAIKQADTEVIKPAFENVPEKMYWTRLAKVFQSEGMAANVTERGIVLSW